MPHEQLEVGGHYHWRSEHFDNGKVRVDAMGEGDVGSGGLHGIDVVEVTVVDPTPGSTYEAGDTAEVFPVDLHPVDDDWVAEAANRVRGGEDPVDAILGEASTEMQWGG